jgi:predicted MFS family arabinose efflux permease
LEIEKKHTGLDIAIMAITAGVCVANIYYNQPILKDIAASFNISETKAGLIPVLTQAGYGLGLFFITPLGDKIPRKKLICMLQLLLMAVLLCITFTTTIYGLYIMSLLLGIVSVSAQVLLPMAAALDKENRGKNVSIVFTGVLIGILAARVISGYIALWLGWRYVFGISSLLVLIVALLTWFILPTIPVEFKGNYGQLLRSTFLQVKRFPLLRRTALIGAFIFGAFCSFWTTLTFFLSGKPFYYHTDTIGLFGILAIGGALLAPVFGKLADKGHTTRSQIITISLMIAGVLLMKFLPFNIIALLLVVLLLDVGVQATQITNIAVIYTLDETAHSRINTVYMTTYFLGGALGTYAGVKSWHIGGWQMVAWQLLLWSVIALAIACKKSKVTKTT